MKIFSDSLKLEFFLALFACLIITEKIFSDEESKPSTTDMGNARIVFVGDSITGLGGGWKNTGFTFPMQEALKAAHTGCNPTLVALGGSGMGVQSWIQLTKLPLKQERELDVKGVGVKKNLSERADLLVVMLGMNDLIAPYVGDTESELDLWQTHYRELIQQLRKLTRPKVIGIASITMQTEDPNSAKNRLLATMNKRIRSLAKELDCRYLPVNEAIWEVQRQGRTFSPDFHATYDMIHPAKFGQLAIAIGMLRGLGEKRAADYLMEQKVKPQIAKLIDEQPIFSYRIKQEKVPLDADQMSFRIKYWLHQQGKLTPQVRLSVPPEWKVIPEKIKAVSGEFEVTGIPDRIQNLLQLKTILKDKTVRQTITIPAPWRVTAGYVQPFWNGLDFQPEKAENEIDTAIETGADFLSLVESSTDPHAGWQRYFASVNYLGGNQPGNIDFAAITHGRNFEAGYGVRWIHSEKSRSVLLQLSKTGLASSNIFLTIWMNGIKTYSSHLDKKAATVQIQLKQGWNCLVFKSNHRTWDWHNRIELSAKQGDSLAKLRYATHPARKLD